MKIELLQASRNGYYVALDRATGKSLVTKPFATVNWAKGIDAEGRPIPDPAKEPARDGRGRNTEVRIRPAPDAPDAREFRLRRETASG